MRIFKSILLFVLMGCFIFSDPPNWDSDGDGLFDDITSYLNTGSITATVSLDGTNPSTDGDLIGAFVDGELRGIGTPLLAPFGPYAGTALFYTYIYSNESSGEMITFQFYDNETDTVYDIDETIEFTADMTLGGVTTPEILTGTLGGGTTGGGDGGVFIPTDGCELPENTVYLTDTGDVLYNIPEDIGGYQFTVDGTTANGASSGESASAGFTVSAGGSTVLAFSFTGATINTDCGILTTLSLAGDATGLSDIVFSNSSAETIDVSEFDPNDVYGCTDIDACNYNFEANVDDGSCEGNPIIGGPPTDACSMDENMVYLTDTGEVWYNIPEDIGGYQFSVDGTTANGASGGESADAGFTVSAGGSTILAFSFTGATISNDCGLLTTLSLAGDATGLSDIVFSNSSAETIDVTEFDASGILACDCDGNLEDECGVCDGDGAVYDCGCSDIAEGACDCDGNVDVGCGCGEDGPSGCDNTCGSTAEEDECGVCGGGGAVYDCGCTEIPDGDCDCDGNIDDCNADCNGSAYVDQCEECVGGTTGLDACPIDCNGEFGGTAVTDACGTCVLGSTGLPFVDDSDTDGVCDTLDTCPLDDENDADSDGICGNVDACPYDAENDADGDLICGDVDACPNDSANDDDGDGVCGDVDVCPGFDDNLDADADTLADGCDACPNDADNDADEDGVCGDIDVCPGFDDNLDADADGTADGCDICPLDANDDIDADGICGDVDTCPLDADNDADADGICGDVDTCPLDADNDADGDDICGDVDACPLDAENDADDDNICGDIDACPLDAENDADGDGVCSNDEVYGCIDSLALNYNELATENSGCIYDFETPPDEFSNNVSSSLAYYFIGSVTIDGTVLSPEDWLGAFNGDVCVGARRWNTQVCSNGVCDIPVYGDDSSSLTEGYMTEGDIPTFKVYDYDANGGAGAFYNVNGPDTNGDGQSNAGIDGNGVPIWSFYGANYVPQLSIIEDCTNLLGGSTFDADQDGYCDCPCEDVNEDGSIQDCSNGCDLDPTDDSCWIDTDLDGSCDPYDICAGFNDNIDYDTDGEPDGCDNDDDDDGAFDSLDTDDNNEFVCSDNDGDTCDDCTFGIYNISDDGFDYDLDGACDLGDDDDDNDSALDDDDSDDNNPLVCNDADGDGCDECASGTFNSSNDGADLEDYDADGMCDNGDVDDGGLPIYPNGVPDTDDDNDGALDENDDADNDQYACSDTELISFFEEDDIMGDGCDDCSSGVFDINNDGSDFDADSLCDINDFCDQDPANDADGDGICFNDETLGCMDVNAINLNAFASDDDGTCLFSSNYSLDYHEGANLTSYSLHPTLDEFSVVDFSGLFSADNLNSVLGDESATTFVEGIGWIGSLDQVDKLSGYWLKLQNSDTIDFDAYPHGQNISDVNELDNTVLGTYFEPFDLSYSLNSGNNLISFPGENNTSLCAEGELGCEVLVYDFLDVLPEALSGVLTGVSGAGTFATFVEGVGWAGSLVDGGLQGFKGYWFKSNEDIEFSFDFSNPSLARRATSNSKESLPGYEFVQSSSQAGYFIKHIPQANINDWIIALNNDVVIGARKWTGQIIDIPVMGYDGESYSIGYMNEGYIPTFMLYNSDTGNLEELYGLIPEYANNEIFMLDQLTTDDYIVPTQIALHDAYPNPFNPVTNISFSLPSKMDVELNILDIQGRIVQKVLSNSYNEGLNSVTIDGNNLSSGLYFIQLIAGQDVHYTKVLLLK